MCFYVCDNYSSGVNIMVNLWSNLVVEFNKKEKEKH